MQVPTMDNATMMARRIPAVVPKVTSERHCVAPSALYVCKIKQVIYQDIEYFVLQFYQPYKNFNIFLYYFCLTHLSLTYNGHSFQIRICNIMDQRLICFAVTILLMIFHFCSEYYSCYAPNLFRPVARKPMIPTIPGPRNVKIAKFRN